jgi:hypothetical protein
VQYANELGQPSRKSSGWAKIAKGMEEQMVKIKQNLKATQARHKIYVDKGRTHRDFKVGDHVFLKVKAKRISLKLGNCSKLAARYCGPFEILERIGPSLHHLHPCAFIMYSMCLYLKGMYLVLIM